MREILFRGKRLDNGEWIEGSLVIWDDRKYIFPDEGVWLENYCTDIIGEVIPETVGQFAGMLDKNGKKIFEGDIIHYEIRQMSDSGFPYKDNKYNHQKVGPVIFTDQCFLPLTYCVKETVLVVGNIHDNPELLKGEKK